MPILRIGLPCVKPSVPFSTMNALMARSDSGRPSPLSILAYTTQMSAKGALVMKVFEPEIT